MELLLQFIVLAFTACVWWLARRDLTLRAAQLRAGDAEELERLRAGVESLAADLERRADAAEARLAARIAEARTVGLRPAAPGPVAPREDLSPAPRAAVPAEESGAAGKNAQAPEDWEATEDRYAPALALAAAGITDPTEIARRTGLARGEVALLLSLRARHDS